MHNGGHHQAALRSKASYVVQWGNNVSDTERQGKAV